MGPTSENNQPFRLPSTVMVLGLVVLGALIACLIHGWDYYTLAASQRPFRPEYSVLRPSGRMGLVWGLVGAVLILFNLSYLVRRHLIGWHGLGSLRTWLGLHMMTGLTAAFAAILHSTLMVSSPLAALAFWCLLLTAMTGLSGIIIYFRLAFSVESRDIQGAEPSPSLILHIIVAVRFGGLWILGGRS